MKRTATAVLVFIVPVLLLAALYVYSGAYNIAADEPHWGLTERLLETVRLRSIAVRARDIRVPNLEDEKMVRRGAAQYAEMCQACHMAPGVDDSPLRQGLYPEPPDLSRHRMEPREAFWIVKHGIKMTGMPAWGPSHDDETLWSIVAFMQKLPGLSAEQYKSMVSTTHGSPIVGKPKADEPSQSDHGSQEHR